jgi:hypothetical protein
LIFNSSIFYSRWINIVQSVHRRVVDLCTLTRRKYKVALSVISCLSIESCYGCWWEGNCYFSCLIFLVHTAQLSVVIAHLHSKGRPGYFSPSTSPKSSQLTTNSALLQRGHS